MIEALIGSLDPGRFKDAFAFVLTKYHFLENRIYVMGAHGWNNQEFPVVEARIAKIHAQQRINFMVCEKNNVGFHVIESLRKFHHMKVYDITTMNQIKSQKIIMAAKTMDKVEMVGWINKKRLEHKIVFPIKKTAGIKTLEAQLDSFVRFPPKDGKSTIMKYGAEGQQHDDFAMAFMINCFFIRRRLMKDFGKLTRTIVSRKYNSETIDILGTGIPEGAISLGTSIQYPQGMSSTRSYKVH